MTHESGHTGIAQKIENRNTFKRQNWLNLTFVKFFWKMWKCLRWFCLRDWPGTPEPRWSWGSRPSCWPTFRPKSESEKVRWRFSFVGGASPSATASTSHPGSSRASGFDEIRLRPLEGSVSPFSRSSLGFSLYFLTSLYFNLSFWDSFFKRWNFRWVYQGFEFQLEIIRFLSLLQS